MTVAVIGEATRERPRPQLTLGPIVARYFERKIRHVEGTLAGRPMALEEWQRDDLDLVYEVDEDGQRVWHTVLWGQAKGNGKTPIVGGISTLELQTWLDGPKVYCGAGAREQAGLIMNFTRETILQGPLRDHLVVRASSVRAPRSASRPHPGLMRVVSAEGSLQHGLNISFAAVDEKHVIVTPKQEEMVFALATALKRPYSWEMAITNAGALKTTLLGEEYESMLTAPDVWVSPDGCLTIARDREAGQLMIWRGLPDGADVGDETLWRAVNPASWVSMEYLRRQARKLPANVFKRFHLSMWSGSDAAAFVQGAWAECASPGVAIEDGAPVYLAVRVDERRENAALAAVVQREDGRRVASVELWEDADPATLVETVKAAIAAACDRWRHRSLAFVPWQFAGEAKELRHDGVRLFRGERATQDGMAATDSFLVPMSQRLFDDVAEQRLVHDGDRHLSRHVLAVESKGVGRGAWKMVRPEPGRDGKAACVEGAFALAMALLACEQDGQRAKPWAAAW